jgi:glucosyl-3-phosphoglycerate phosphatase
MTLTTNGNCFYIARHGETVYNAIGKMQGQRALHTPLTRNGFFQADEMGYALAAFLKDKPQPVLWASTAGRALQTLAVIAEHIGADWHETKRDERLQEIDVGDWSERIYADIAAETGPFVCPETRLYTNHPPNGEWYDDVAARLRAWLADVVEEPGDKLVLMHGISARILRGIMLGLPAEPRFGAPFGRSLAQGSMVMIRDGVETLVVDGAGMGERA